MVFLFVVKAFKRPDLKASRRRSSRVQNLFSFERRAMIVSVAHLSSQNALWVYKKLTGCTQNKLIGKKNVAAVYFRYEKIKEEAAN